MDDLTRLALSARSGDDGARRDFVRRAQPEVWRLCSALVGRDHADDLTQDAFLRILKALPTFRGESSARTWLLSITRFTCADWIRTQQRQRRLANELADLATFTAESETGRVDLDQLLDELAPDRRDAFVLTQVLGLSYAEAAEVCDCKVGTIRSRVSRAREELVAGVRGQRLEDLG